MATTYDAIAVIIDKARDHANDARNDRHPALLVLAVHELAAAVSNLAELSEKHGGRLFALEKSLEPSKYDDDDCVEVRARLQEERDSVARSYNRVSAEAEMYRRRVEQVEAVLVEISRAAARARTTGGAPISMMWLQRRVDDALEEADHA